MNKQQAVANIQSLIDASIFKGGVFKTANQVAAVQESLNTLIQLSLSEEHTSEEIKNESSINEKNQ